VNRPYQKIARRKKEAPGGFCGLAHPPTPVAKRNLFSYLNVKFAVCTVPSDKVTINCLQVLAQGFDVCQL
jgi:hypothetical protein